MAVWDATFVGGNVMGIRTVADYGEDQATLDMARARHRLRPGLCGRAPAPPARDALAPLNGTKFLNGNSSSKPVPDVAAPTD
jgi:hypothetical protein